MRKKTKPPIHKFIIINLTEDEINRRVDQIESLSCDDDLRQFLIDALRTLVELDRLVGMKNTTIMRLRKIFNKETEKKPRNNNNNPSDDKKKPGRGNNQGRNGKDDYPLAPKCQHKHSTLKVGDVCPECGQGTLASYTPGVHIRITGSPPLQATIHETEKFRCNGCLKIFEASFEGKDAPKYDASAIALVALFKYEGSFPFYRLEKIQKQFLTPMPASTQFDLMERLANDVAPMWEYLLTLAPEGELFYIDDTKVKVLSLIAENKHNVKSQKKVRKGMYTTGIISEVDGHKIILYYTGRKYAGENLEILLKKRKSTDDPKVMSDAARTNRLDLDFIQIFCHAHGRRKFVDIERAFEEETKKVIDWIADIYKNDAFCKENKFTPEERLTYHQEKSRPIMEELKTWCKLAFEEKKVEENSSLGKAIQYLLNQWEGLNTFLKMPGIPLDNNILEGNFRTQVLNKKNWLFYKSETGALIGDIICSILKTAVAAKANPFYYLKWLQENKIQVKENPERFLPWNMPPPLVK